MRKAAILAGSHLICLAAGAYLASAGPGSRHGRPPEAAATKSGDRASRAPLAARGEALAAEMLTASMAPLFDATEAKRAAARFSARGSGEKRVRELAESGTLPETAEFAGAMLAWFREDPMAAIEFMQAGGAGRFYDAVLVEALEELALGDHVKLAMDLGMSPARIRVGEILGKRLAGTEPALAAEIWKEITRENPQLLSPIVNGWPADDPGGFLDLALAAGDVEVLKNYLSGGTHPRKASALLVLMETRDDLPPEFSDFLAETSELRGHLYRYADPSVPLDVRIAEMRNLAWLKDATPEALREGALKQISTVDINELMKTGPDYRYAFRHGAMTADEVLAAVRETFPELAAASDFETRVRVFNELASEDAQAAFALIAHLPEEQRNLAVIHQSRWTFRDTAPEAFFEMINLAPGPDSQEAAPQRAEAWTVYGSSAFREYGDYYIDWVRELPPGTNRDAARSSLAMTLRQANQPDLAAEFEAP